MWVSLFIAVLSIDYFGLIKCAQLNVMKREFLFINVCAFASQICLVIRVTADIAFQKLIVSFVIRLLDNSCASCFKTERFVGLAHDV